MFTWPRRHDVYYRNQPVVHHGGDGDGAGLNQAVPGGKSLLCRSLSQQAPEAGDPGAALLLLLLLSLLCVVAAVSHVRSSQTTTQAVVTSQGTTGNIASTNNPWVYDTSHQTSCVKNGASACLKLQNRVNPPEICLCLKLVEIEPHQLAAKLGRDERPHGIVADDGYEQLRVDAACT